jgi:B12-binding domain/radical SAM domain protein
MDYDVIYDAVLIHPPAIYDFRKKPLFSGALGSTVERIQLIKVPLGMLSIADYLDRHGYKALVDNLADRMVNDKAFDAEEHIRNISARIYAIGLHFHHHCQGAIEVAKLCKKLHPDALVILGGLTATYFHKEIIRKYKFIDAVIRGEGEKPFLQLIRALEKHGKLTATPNLTYRTDAGKIRVTPLMKGSENLDEFEFIRFDLLEPKTSIFTSDEQTRWSLQVCRGCTYNCVTCGGSAYSYKTYFGMERPSFRSPGKIVEDIKRLNDQGIHRIGLYQDPRMGGEKYWKELMATLRREKLEIEMFSMDLLTTADEEFIREVATIGKPVMLYICPDSGACDVRRAQGRCYSNEDLLNTVELCYRYHIPVTVFFSVGLAGETHETIKETWELWDKLCSLDQMALIKGSFGKIERGAPMGGPIIGPIILEPGALAFDFPERYGYKLIFSNLEKYIKGLSQPSWHQWLNHETNLLDKNAFIELIFESIDYSINQREKYGVYNKSQATVERFRAKVARIAVDEVNRIMNLPDRTESESRLRSLRDALDSFLNSSPFTGDIYGYREMMWKNTVLMYRIRGQV